jgi:hypothetical protein
MNLQGSYRCNHDNAFWNLLILQITKNHFALQLEAQENYEVKR